MKKKVEDPLFPTGFSDGGTERTLQAAKAKLALQSDFKGHVWVPDDYQLYDLLSAVVKNGASDLHLSVGLPPMYRVHGELYRAEAEVLSQERAERMLLPVITEEQSLRYRASGTVDFAYNGGDLGRFRGNLFDQYRGMGAVFRVIPPRAPTLDELEMPAAVRNLAGLRSGFVLFTGPTGSGKSTTMAALIDSINQTRNAHIITIEDPVEYIHQRNKCLIDHREIGQHAVSFSDALIAALREDPDILLIGEMRDLETIHNAIRAAETGILVLATLHTNTAAQSVDRIVDVFPARQQDQIRIMVAESLKAVVSQQLVKRANGRGRIAVQEILLWSPGLANLIREAKTHHIPNYIQMGRYNGMQTLDGTLRRLVENRVVTLEDALDRATDPDHLKDAL